MSGETATTMKAWVHYQRGPPQDVLSLSNVPIVALTSPTQVRIKISHCALNPGGSILMHLVPFLFRTSPSIPEMDFSGTVDKMGTGVPPERGLASGMQVFGSIPVGHHVRSGSGSLAEYVLVDHGAVVEVPNGANMEEMAGLGIAGPTALELLKAANLKRGDSVLVNGASGGVGHLAIQMCRDVVGETGRVVAICSGDNAGWVKDLGADEVIDYREHGPVHKYLAETFGASRFSAVVDAVGIKDIFQHCPQYLAEEKPYVTVGPRMESYTVLSILSSIGLMVKNALWPRLLGGVPRDYRQVASVTSTESLQELARMVEGGKLRVHVRTKVKLEDAKQAYAKLLSGHAQGKIVVEL